ncbi:hypothetical protein Tco_0578832 [Tanacetum coccineum]
MTLVKVGMVSGTHGGLEVGWIRRIQVLDTAYWGFLGVGTTFDIFQNIILIPYLEYGVFSSLDTAYWSSFFCGISASKLQNIIPQIVTQVTDNVNNANGGNGNDGNNGCSYKTFTTCNLKEFDGKGGAVALTCWIEKMESVFDNISCTANQRVRFHELAKLVPHLVTPKSFRIKRILTDEVVCCGTLTKGNDKRKEMEEFCKQGSTWKDNKKSKTRLGFVATIPPRNDNVNTYLSVLSVILSTRRMHLLGWGRIRGHATNLGVLIILSMIASSGNKQLDKQGTRWL